MMTEATWTLPRGWARRLMLRTTKSWLEGRTSRRMPPISRTMAGEWKICWATVNIITMKGKMERMVLAATLKA